MYNKDIGIMTTITIELYLIRHGYSCSNVIDIIKDKKSGNNLVKHGTAEYKSLLSPDSLLSNLGIYQSELINENLELQHMLLRSDAICCSVLSRAIESAWIMFQRRYEIYPVPYVSEHIKPIVKIRASLLKSLLSKKDNNNNNDNNNDNNEKHYLTLGHNKSNLPKTSKEETYKQLKKQFEYNKEFWNILTLRPKNGIVKLKVPKIDWQIVDKYIKSKNSVHPSVRLFFKHVIPDLIRKTDEKKNQSNKYIFTLVTHESFIIKIIKKFLEEKRNLERIEPTSIFKVTFDYDVRNFRETLLKVEKIYPTSYNHNMLTEKEGKYYVMYGIGFKSSVPLDDKEITLDDIYPDIFSKCPHHEIIEKRVKILRKNRNKLRHNF